MVSKKEENKLEKYWDNENYAYQKMPRYCDIATQSLFYKLFKDVKGKKILDIGCGHGRMINYFNKRGAKAYGIDISPESVNFCKSNGLNVRKADTCDLPFKDNSFDVVYSIGVVEHFDETMKAIVEHIRVTKPGGYSVIIVPHTFAVSYPGAVLVHYLRGHKYDLMTTIGKAYTKKKFKKMLNSFNPAGLRVFAYYGSAFLKPLTRKVYKKTSSYIDNSGYSRLFGHLLCGVFKK